VRSYVGLRRVAAENGRFELNGRPYFLRLALEQAYWRQSHLAAPSDDALRREVELAKSLGFNGIRMHQTTADPRFLYWCDRLWLLLWADAPAAYRFSPRAIARSTREWLEIVERDASHPSIVVWVAFNESWGVPDLAVDAAQRHAVHGLAALLKALDPTRPVIGNDGWEYIAGDIVGIHDYTQSGAQITERYGDAGALRTTVKTERPGGRRLSLAGEVGAEPDLRGRPVVLSEFGGIGFTPADDAWDGYGSVDDERSFVLRLSELVGAAARSNALAGFCYTQLTDTLQERNGLLDEDRKPKVDIAVIRKIITG
jgi:hypothetical protein